MSNRYDEWFKLQVAQQCLHDDASLREIARQHGLDHSLVRTWRDSYRQHGVVALRKKYTHRSAAFKLQVLETMWRDGLSRRQTQALFDIRECGAIGRWERQYHSGGLTALGFVRKVGSQATVYARQAYHGPETAGQFIVSRADPA